MTTCKGCGVHLQYENKLLPGYTPKKESEYCAPNAKFTITPKRKKGKLAVSSRVIASDGTACEFVNAVDDGFGTIR